jgi:hypothetical protein
MISAKNWAEATNGCPKIVPVYIQLQPNVAQLRRAKTGQQFNPKNIQQSRNLRENVLGKWQGNPSWQAGGLGQRFVEETHIFIIFP